MRGQGKLTPVLSTSGVLTKPDGKSFSIGSETWVSWLEEAQSFYYQGEQIGFTVRPEKRRQRSFWYAFKKIAGKTRKKYIGNNQSLTLEALQLIERDWQLSLGNVTAQEQVTQHSDFPNDVLYGLFDDEPTSAYLAWENPETRYRARAGLYFIRYGDWLFEIQKTGQSWIAFAFSGRKMYTEYIKFDSLKQATYVVSTMSPH